MIKQARTKVFHKNVSQGFRFKRFAGIGHKKSLKMCALIMLAFFSKLIFKKKPLNSRKNNWLISYTFDELWGQIRFLKAESQNFLDPVIAKP